MIFLDEIFGVTYLLPSTFLWEYFSCENILLSTVYLAFQAYFTSSIFFLQWFFYPAANISLLFIILRVTYYSFCDGFAEYNLRMFLSTNFVSLSAYFSNNGFPHTLPLQSSFRSVYTNFLPIFRPSPYKLIVYPNINLLSVSFSLSS